MFSKRVDALAQELGSNAALARRLGVDRSLVGKWRAGSSDPDGPGGPLEICIQRLERGLPLLPEEELAAAK